MSIRNLAITVLFLAAWLRTLQSWAGAPTAENGVPPLIEAIRSGDRSKLERLLLRRADPNLKPSGAWDYPLFEAVLQRNLPAVEALIEHGADPHIKGGRKLSGNEGQSPISICLGRSDPSPTDADIIEYLTRQGVESEGATPLMLAVIRRDMPTAELLIERGADVNVYNRANRTALDYAHPDPRFLKLLLKAGGRHSFSGVELASMLGDTNQLAKELAKLENVRTNYAARSALSRAIKYNNPVAVQMLLERGVSQGPDSIGQTALCLAARYGRNEVIGTLLRFGADPSDLCDGLRTPAEMALTFGWTNSASLLEKAPKLR